MLFIQRKKKKANISPSHTPDIMREWRFEVRVLSPSPLPIFPELKKQNNKKTYGEHTWMLVYSVKNSPDESHKICIFAQIKVALTHKLT